MSAFVLVPARRSRAGASDSDGGGVDEVSPALPASAGVDFCSTFCLTRWFGPSALTLLLCLSIVVGLVHNLCEPGFFGDSKFAEFDRWFLSTFGLLVISVISLIFGIFFLFGD